MAIMASLVSQLMQGFRCILSSVLTTNHSSLVHHLNIPLPQVLHKKLSQEFMDGFDEVVVIGDIHGCYDEMVLLLDQINANNKMSDSEKRNSKRILKLFVGDLVNKGPKSREVVEFMIENMDSCLSVRGNHDEVVVDQYLKYEKWGQKALVDRNKWMAGLTRKHIDYLISLPYTISIPSLNALVVHAGIVPNVALNSQNLKDMVEMRNLVSQQNTDNEWSERQILSATSSHKMGEPWVSLWSGPEHIYFGHDAIRKLQLSPYSTGLDTGCVYGNALTAVFIHGQRKGTFVSVNAIQVHSQPKTPLPVKPEE